MYGKVFNSVYDSWYTFHVSEAAEEKVLSDVLYAHMHHEACLLRAHTASMKDIKDQAAAQEEYDKQESGYYEDLEWYKRSDEEAWEQVQYMERTGKFLKHTKPFIPSYVKYVQKIEEALG